MDRGAWGATVHWVTSVGHDWTTKPPPQNEVYTGILDEIAEKKTVLC